MMHSSHAKLGIAEVSWVHFPKFLKYLFYKERGKLKKKTTELSGKYLFALELPSKGAQGARAQELSFWVRRKGRKIYPA